MKVPRTVALTGGVLALALAGPAPAGGQLDVFRMKAGGGGTRRLTDSPHFDFAPDWQPVPRGRDEDNEEES
jgi:hypothetical protein